MKIAYKLRAFAITGLGSGSLEPSFYKPPLFSGGYKMTDPCISSGENMGGGVSIKKIYLYIFLTTCWGYKIMVPFKLVMYRL